MNRFALYIGLLMALWSSSASLCFGGGDEIPLSEIEIEFTRSPSNVLFPITSILVNGEGRVLFTYRNGSSGPPAGQVSVDEVIALVSRFTEAWFFDMRHLYVDREFVEMGPGGGVKRYSENIACGGPPARVLRLKLGPKEHKVVYKRFYPTVLDSLAAGINGLVHYSKVGRVNGG